MLTVSAPVGAIETILGRVNGCFWLKMGYPIWSIWFIMIIMTFPIQMPYHGGIPFSDILKLSTIAYVPDISWSIASVAYIPFNSSCSNPLHQQSDYNSQLSFVSKCFTLLISVQSTVFSTWFPDSVRLPTHSATVFPINWFTIKNWNTCIQYRFSIGTVTIHRNC